ncbi:MAG: SCP2 sterol-binding domain-containing protein [Hyphomicrobiales bacterium]|nr:SCP2 sterol-binding domain-containing protein [Hyphomicrobiales bacterium]
MLIDDVEAIIRTHLPTLADLNATVKLDMGADGVLFLDAAGEAPTLSRQAGPSDCTLKVSASNMKKMLSGEMNPLMAVAFGRIKVDGDRRVATRLTELMRRG